MVIDWKELIVFERTDAAVSAPWILVLESFEGMTHLRIQAEGSWKAMGNLLAPCEPDGIAGLPLPSERLMVADCPVGALIGKIGGSSAASAAADAEGKVFPIGSYCVVGIPEKSPGPLFIGFNCIARPVMVGRVKVVVSGTALPS
jgi:hypothetical protein